MSSEPLAQPEPGTRRLDPPVELRPSPDRPDADVQREERARRGFIAAMLLGGAALAVSIVLQFAQRPGPAELVARIDVSESASAPAADNVVLAPAAADAPSAPAAVAELPSGAPVVAARTAAVPAAVPVSAGMRLRIPRIGVDAPMVTLGLGAGGQMPAPSDDFSVAWYDFSAMPGAPGNVLLAGHVDWVDHAAVFWHLRSVLPGDSITVTSGGQAFVYTVDRIYTVPFDVHDTTGIVGRRSGAPTLTIVTCAGTFNAARHGYDQRLVVASSLRS